MVGTILLITADPATTRQVQRACDAIGVGMTLAASAEQAIAALGSGSAELVIGDLGSLERLRLARPGLHAVLLTDTPDSRQTIEAMKRGALDCLIKPLQHEDLVRRINDALRLCRHVEEESTAAPGTPGTRPVTPTSLGVRLVGQSPAMQEVYKLIGMIAPRNVNVLITGESGTGKELVAHALHEHSVRFDKPFLAVNSAAIPETLLESELFGHEKGAFTGAEQRRLGKFEQCHGGTLFLDEIGDIPPAIQAKLLRVLESRSFQRLGGNQTITADVRIIAATHQPLEQLIKDKRFREDLYYRLKVATIHMPPLRDREVDAVLLAHYFVGRFNPSMGTNVLGFAPEAVAALLSYPWPGNVRELENVIKSSLVVARGSQMRLEFLPEHVRTPAPAPGSDLGKATAASDSLASRAGLADVVQMRTRTLIRQASANVLAEVTRLIEPAVIEATLNEADGQLTRAAELLGISRTTLRKKMQEYQINLRTAATQRKANS